MRQAVRHEYIIANEIHMSSGCRIDNAVETIPMWRRQQFGGLSIISQPSLSAHMLVRSARS